MKQKRILIAWVILISSLFMAGFAAIFNKSEIEKTAETDFINSCNEISSKIDNRLRAHAQVLRNSAAFFNVSDTVTREQWKVFIEKSSISKNLPGIQGTGFSLVIPSGNLQQHIQKIRNEGFPEYTVNPEGERDIYTSIIFLEPFSDRNQRAFGYDMFSEPVRREAMERARDMDVAALSGKVMLVQETGTDVQSGNLMYVPVYRRGAETKTIEQRRNAIKGWVYSPYRMDDLMNGILKGWEFVENKMFYLNIFDGPECTPQSLLFESHTPEEQSASEKIRFTVQIPIDFNGHQWNLVFTQQKGNLFIDYKSAWISLFGGTIISLLLFFLARSLIFTENKARQKAEVLTFEIKEKERLLRNKEERLRMIVKAGNVGLWDWNLITNNTYFSPEWKNQLGYADDELQNTYETWESLFYPDDLAPTLKILKASLTAPWPPYHVEFRLRHKDGSYRWILAQGNLQFDELENPLYMLGSHVDITERKQVEEQLREKQERLRTIIETEPECVKIIDTNGKLQEMNPAGLAMIEAKTLDEAQQPPFLDFVLPKYHAPFMELFHEVMKGGKGTLEFEIKGFNGTVRWVETHDVPLFDADSKVVGLLAVTRDITKRKQAELARLDSELRMKLATEASEIGIWEWNVETSEIRWDAQMFQIYGITPSPDGFLKYSDWSGTVIPEELKQQEELLMEMVEGRLDHNLREFRIRRPGETSVRVIQAIETVRNRVNGRAQWIIGTNRDITEQKRAKEEILQLNTELEEKVKTRTEELEKTNIILHQEIEERSQAEERIRLVYDASPYSILLVDSKGIIRMANPTTEEYFGYDNARIIGANVDMLIPKERGTHHAGNISSFFRNLEKRKMGAGRDLLALKKDGTVFQVEIGITPIEISGETMVLTNIIDITERKQAEDKINKAMLEAEQANKAKSEFLSRMSHELRTPMNSILGFAQLMNMGELKPAHKKGVNHILRSGKHLLYLINEVLDISKIEVGHISLSIEPVEVCHLMKEIKDIIKPLAAGNQITLEINPPVTTLFVSADLQRLKQVLLNLANNAIKYNHAGGSVQIEVHSLQSTVFSGQSSIHSPQWTVGSPSETEGGRPETEDRRLKTVRISVTDTGLGIAPEDIKKLFNPFERIGAEKTETEGTGLGLAVVKKLTDAMNGEVGVESELGKGSTFWVELPLAESPAQQAQLTLLTTQATETTQKGGTILYIEDNSSNIELLDHIIKDHRPSFRLITDKYGKNTIRLATEYKPDLILLDLDLPDIHGSKVLMQLQSNSQTKSIPVVVISADAMEKQIEKLMKAGAKDYLTKPLDVIEFLRVVDTFLNKN